MATKISPAKPLLKFTVKRSRWRRGGTGQTSLLIPGSAMCCLGFYCRQAGLSSKAIYDQPMPSAALADVHGLHRISPKLTRYNGRRGWYDTQLCWDVADANDDSKLDQTMREAKLKKLFEKAGITVKFVP